MKALHALTERRSDAARREMTGSHRRGSDDGFTLVEILIAIVLVGVLSAVVVVGISNLTDKGAKSACTASLDAAKAGSVVYYAANGNAYPTSFTDLTAEVGGTPAALTLPSDVTVSPDAMSIASGSSWTLTMTNTKTGAPTFACS
jgi:prepilin-type N-terminal cleavage/methylation domain-containing protein